MLFPPEGEAIRLLAFDLYERARAADKPTTFPSPAITWSIVEAPRVAQCLHAAAVLLDCLKQFSHPLPAQVLPFQTAAHKRSVQLASQLAQVLKTPAVIPTDWRPADLNAAVPVHVPPPRAAPPAALPASAFPSVPK